MNFYACCMGYKLYKTWQAAQLRQILQPRVFNPWIAAGAHKPSAWMFEKEMNQTRGKCRKPGDGEERWQ